MSRYERNFPAFSEDDFNKIQNATIAVVGCGGLGGYVIEMLTRVGVGSLRLIDGDIFESSNLNRQLLSSEKNLGISKAAVGKERVSVINSEVSVEAFHAFLKEENGLALLKNSDLVIDALDNVPSRFVLQTLCLKKNIPLVHGAIGGWFGQVTTIFPGDDTLSKIYSKEKKYDSKASGNPSFTPGLVASIQVSEALKIITGKEDLLRKELLYIDLLSNDFFTIKID
ncbi:MAG: HesA/MoeB/ThiF family protein [Eubacteriaceae bacterium]